MPRGNCFSALALNVLEEGEFSVSQVP
jgi:hypothetical protein